MPAAMPGVFERSMTRSASVGNGSLASGSGYSTSTFTTEHSLQHNGWNTKFNDNKIWRGLSHNVTVQSVVGLLALISTHLYTHVVLGSHHHNFLSSMKATRLSLPQTGPRDHTASWISLINEVLMQCCFSLILASSIIYVGGSTALDFQHPLSQTLAVIAFLISLDCATNSLIIAISLRVMRVNATALQLVMERLNEPQLETAAQCFATPFSSLIWSMISFGLCMASYYMHGGSTSIPASIDPGPVIAATGVFDAPHSNSSNSLEPRGIDLPPLGCVSVVIIVVLAIARTIVNIRSLSQLRFKGKAGGDPEAYDLSENSQSSDTAASSTGRDEFLSSIKALGDNIRGLAPDNASSTIGPTSETN